MQTVGQGYGLELKATGMIVIDLFTDGLNALEHIRLVLKDC
jgi:hypothetical protein